jgi:hypothetical protein
MAGSAYLRPAVGQVYDLRAELVRMESRCAQVETAVREEMGRAMEVQVGEMETIFEVRR